MQTRQFPRTMQEAFGPYTSRDIVDPDASAGYGRAWWIVMALIAIVALAIVFNTPVVGAQ